MSTKREARARARLALKRKRHRDRLKRSDSWIIRRTLKHLTPGVGSPGMMHFNMPLNGPVTLNMPAGETAMVHQNKDGSLKVQYADGRIVYVSRPGPDGSISVDVEGGHETFRQRA